MRFGRFVGSALAVLGLVVGVQACAILGSDSDALGERICTPGANVFCRCADRTEGTKLCAEDGTSFAACTTGTAGQCNGGEIDDPDTGKPVDQNGVVIEPGPDGSAPVTNDIETCPGKPQAVSPGADIVVEGDTTGARDDMKGRAGACIAGGGGPDHVYRLQPTGTGQLQVKVQGHDGLNPTVYLRSTCGDEEAQLACGETTGVAGAEQFGTSVVTGKEYFLVVDGASGTAGKYTITLKLTTGAVCGDGKVDPNEACDDGNKTEGDGCSNSCQKVDGDPASANGCPGHPVSVWPGRTVTGTGNTSSPNLTNAFTKTGSSCAVSANNLNAAPDHVYEVTARGNGTLKVALTPDPAANLMLVARTTCADPASQGPDMCANLGSNGDAESMQLQVTSGQKVYVAVDGAGTVNNKGAYSVSFQLQ